MSSIKILAVWTAILATCTTIHFNGKWSSSFQICSMIAKWPGLKLVNAPMKTKQSLTEILAGSSYLYQLLHCPDYFLKRKKNFNVELDNEEIVAKKNKFYCLMNTMYHTAPAICDPSFRCPYDLAVVWYKVRVSKFMGLGRDANFVTGLSADSFQQIN